MKKTPAAIRIAESPSGGWAVRSEAGRIQSYPTKAEAVDAARSSIRKSGGEVTVHEGRGRIKSTFTLGRTTMQKLNAVEGLTLSQGVNEAFDRFDREGLSSEQRREKLHHTLAGKKKR